MQPILRCSRSGAAWVREPTTWLPGRTYARRVGKWGRTALALGMGCCPLALARVRRQLLLAPGGFCSSQIPQIRRERDKGQSAGILLV